MSVNRERYGELLQRLKIDVVTGQESWEREGKAVAVDGLEGLVRIRVVIEGKAGLGSWFGSA